MFAPSHWGWASPGPSRVITRFDSKLILPPTSMDVYSSPMAGYFENQMTIEDPIALTGPWSVTRVYNEREEEFPRMENVSLRASSQSLVS